MEESPHFKLVSPVESEKIGPGLTALYKVLFMPDENKVIIFIFYVDRCLPGIKLSNELCELNLADLLIGLCI